MTKTKLNQLAELAAEWNRAWEDWCNPPAERARKLRESAAHLRRFLDNRSGATAIEYGLIAGGIALVLLPVIAGLGGTLSAVFGVVIAALQASGG
jgi:pilus assembly protein Flp/PilA